MRWMSTQTFRGGKTLFESGLAIIESNTITLTTRRSFSVTTPRSNNPTNDSSIYQQKLDEYFKNTQFNLKPEKPETNLAALKESMETVYLRKRPLVAIDVEAYERCPLKVTEIGIAIYDPLALQHSVFPIIKQGHIIIEEHKKLNNRRFCPDNKLLFMGGVSHMANMKTAKQIMSGVMEEYINRRNGAFVGHHIEGDIKWLRSLGIKTPDTAPIVDTSRLYSYSRRRGATLRGILKLAGIPHGYLHNAGNDAYYTLLAVMALCDPEVRRAKGLDDFIENERLSNPQLKLYKFSDMADIVNMKDVTIVPDELFLNKQE